MSETIPTDTLEVEDISAPAEKESRAASSTRRFRIEKDGDTLVFKRSHLYAVLLPLTFVVGLSVGYLFWGRPAPAEQATAVTQAAQAPSGQEQAVQRYNVSEDGDPSIGPQDAPITIVEFSDYECPYCKRWYNEVYLRLREEYADQVRVVFRDFPLYSIHPNAEPAAVAANCAEKQGEYWEFHNRLFAGEQLGETTYLQYAQDLGLNLDEFKDCLDSEEQVSEIRGDYEYASGLGVRSTPTFFLNGLPIVGAQPYEVFKQVIDQELAGEIP
jgi:protein-disulfide isomerase